jgi:hypothetical protein
MPGQFPGITPLLIFLIFTATLGPFLFGYHLVSQGTVAVVQDLTWIGRAECTRTSHQMQGQTPATTKHL